ncbi:uncharacterized protein [Desmodus rotundus]|uniref:uncharacterized protein isoform X2 n=1 Tax=Desmodus rotundus TaxID=9430 RepID=UPI002380F171|nr:uncharacterized protein LOC112306385 isoform X2 [Desmodus rotundus]
MRRRSIGHALYFSAWLVYFPRGWKAGQRNGENEDQREVERSRKQTPGLQSMLSAAARAGVAEATPGGAEAMGILSPRQARINRRWRAKPLEGKMRKISRSWKKAAVLGKKLAASVNLLPEASSLYFWNGEIEEATEILLLIKTKTSKVDILSSYVRCNQRSENIRHLKGSCSHKVVPGALAAP